MGGPLRSLQLYEFSAAPEDALLGDFGGPHCLPAGEWVNGAAGMARLASQLARDAFRAEPDHASGTGLAGDERAGDERAGCSTPLPVLRLSCPVVGVSRSAHKGSAGPNARAVRSVRASAASLPRVALALPSGEIVRAKACVVTLPLGVLQAGTVAFRPPLPRSKAEAVHRIGLCAYTKVVRDFERCTWPMDAAFLGQVAPEGGWTPLTGAPHRQHSARRALEGQRGSHGCGPRPGHPRTGACGGAEASPRSPPDAEGTRIPGRVNPTRIPGSCPRGPLPGVPAPAATAPAAVLFDNYAALKGVPVLVGTLVGESAARAVDFSDESIVEAACASLRQMLGAGVLPRRIGSRVVRWAEDERSLGSYSHYTVDTEDRDAERLAEPVDGCLFFAGEATDPEYQGSVHAALLSGERAAAEAVKALADEVLADEALADERGRGDGVERSVQ
jgi:hypothetical protein